MFLKVWEAIYFIYVKLGRYGLLGYIIFMIVLVLFDFDPKTLMFSVLYFSLYNKFEERLCGLPFACPKWYLHSYC